MRNAHDSERVHTQAKARATLVYYSCRMEAASQPLVASIVVLTASICQAWREGNDGIANYMLQKITGKAAAVKGLHDSIVELEKDHLALLLPRDVSFVFAFFTSQAPKNWCVPCSENYWPPSCCR